MFSNVSFETFLAYRGTFKTKI